MNIGEEVTEFELVPEPEQFEVPSEDDVPEHVPEPMEEPEEVPAGQHYGGNYEYDDHP